MPVAPLSTKRRGSSASPAPGNFGAAPKTCVHPYRGADEMNDGTDKEAYSSRFAAEACFGREALESAPRNARRAKLLGQCPHNVGPALSGTGFAEKTPQSRVCERARRCVTRMPNEDRSPRDSVAARFCFGMLGMQGGFPGTPSFQPTERFRTGRGRPFAP